MYYSADNENWILFGEKKTNNAPNTAEDTYILSDTQARYIKVCLTDVAVGSDGKRTAIGIYEMAVLGKEIPKVEIDKSGLEAIIAEADGKEQTEYTEKSWNDLLAAIEAARKVYEMDEPTEEQIRDAIDALQDAIDGLKTRAEELEQQKRAKLKSDIKDAVNTASPIINGGQKNYTKDSWDALKDAYNAANLSDTALEAKTTNELEDLLEALNEAQEHLEKTADVTDPAMETAKAEAESAVRNANAVVSAGQGGYSKETWDAFMKAYNELKNAPADTDAATLSKLAEALADAQKALKKEFVNGAAEDAGGIRYQVLDANRKTVTALLGLNKGSKSINIPATVKVKGETCKVVQISDNAFKGYNKATKLTIGANVTAIGKNAFEGCKKLKKVTLQSKVLKSVKGKAFKGTAKKVKVKWPKGLKAKEKNKLKKMFKKAKMKVK